MVHTAAFLTTALALTATSVSGAAVSKRQSANFTDPDILNYALTLEHLESTFYAEALKNYTEWDFKAAGADVRSEIEEIAADEAQHVEFLTAALTAAGATPVGASSYIFPSTDVKSFLGLSQILEGVGVAAYLGAAPDIANKAYLGAAGSILTVEARHNAFIRYANHKSPFPGPEDAALTPRAVVSIAAVFFAPGAKNAPAIVPFPTLAVSPSGKEAYLNETISAKSSASKDAMYCAFISGLEAGFSMYDASKESCKIPSQNVTAGQTYVLLTSAEMVSDATTVAGPAIIDICKS